MNTMIPVAVAWIGIGLIVTSMACFDRVIRWLHAENREKWIELGRPAGYLFRVEGATFWRSAMKRNQLTIQLLFYTPSWIPEGHHVRTGLWYYRCVSLSAEATLVLLWFLVTR